MEEEYLIKLPKIESNLLNDDLTFSIQHIRSRLTSTLYFIVDFYDMSDELIYTYTSKRWVIDTSYATRVREFTVPQDVIDETAYYQITMVACGITSENPLYFVGLMFQDTEYDGYHQPFDKIIDAEIVFNKSTYTNLYNGDGSYLQVIRPSKAKMHTNKLDASPVTVLCPHLDGESGVDSPVNLLLEYLNMTEQRIDVLR